MIKFVFLISFLNLNIVENEVSPDFKECKGFFFNEVIPRGFPKDQNRYKSICQKYKNKYHFATLYDTKNKIPVYSAYKLTTFCRDRLPNRPNKWFMEPQLENMNNPSEMTMGMKKVKHQASNEDYTDMRYNRGHLYPRFYACVNGSVATHTLTNAVPQDGTFNSGNWLKMENAAKTKMNSSCNDDGDERYFITGALPGEIRKRSRDGSYIMYPVNIPTVMWTVACCVRKNQANNFSFGYKGQNKPSGDVSRQFESVADIQEMLNGFYNQGPVTLFQTPCS